MAAPKRAMLPPQIDLAAVKIGKIDDYYSPEQQDAILNPVREFLQPGSEQDLLADVCRAAQEYQSMREMEDAAAARKKLGTFLSDLEQAMETLERSFSETYQSS